MTNLTHEKRIAGCENEILILNERININTTDMVAIVERLDMLDARADTVYKHIDAINKRIDEQDTRINARIDVLIARIDARIDVLIARIDVWADQLVDGDINAIKKSIDTHARINKRIDAIIDTIKN